MDKEDSAGLPNFQPEAIDMFINMAMRKFIKNRYSGSTTGLSFEEIQKRTDDIRSVVDSDTIPPSSVVTTGLYKDLAVSYDLPTTKNYWFSVVSRVENTYEDCDDDIISKFIKIQPATRDRILNIIDDAFAKPSTDYHYYSLMQGNTVYVFPDLTNGPIKIVGVLKSDNVLGNLYIDFVRKPVDVDINASVDCELAEHTHEEVVKEAVSSALETIESQRYPVFNNELQKQE